MLVLGEAELKKTKNLFLSGGGGGGGGGRCVGARAAFFAVGGILRRGFSLFFHLGRRRALIHEKTRPRITLYEQGLIFVRVFFGQSYFDLLL